MNNAEHNGVASKMDSSKIDNIDIDENIFLNNKSFPVNEAYEVDQNKFGGNNQIKDIKEYKRMYEESIKNPEVFWGDMAKNNLRWSKLFNKTYIGNFNKGNVSWFVNGKINACDNCVDRWVEKHPNKTAIIWEKDTPNDSKKISYQKLLEKVCKIANLLKIYGVKKQDCVTIYLPMIPELIYSMLACARIGAIHNVVFAGYSTRSLSERIISSGSTILITSDFGLRGGKLTKLKNIADGAMEMTGMIKTCIVFKNKTKINDQNNSIVNSKSNNLYNSSNICSQGSSHFLQYYTVGNATHKNNNDPSQNGYDNVLHNDISNHINEDTIDKKTEHLNNCVTNNITNMCNNSNNNDTNDANLSQNNKIDKNGAKEKDIQTLNKLISKNTNLNKKNQNKESGTYKELYSNNDQYLIDGKENKLTGNGTQMNGHISYDNNMIRHNQVNAFEQINNYNMHNGQANCEQTCKSKYDFDENICTLKEGRDINGSLLMKNMRPYCPIEYVDSEDFLCILYTSGSTGKPKGVTHTTAGYLLYAFATSKYIFDIKDDDIFGCVADIGWVTGHTYVVYGPLLNGITTTLFSSIPTYPDCSRYWSLIQTHKITQFYTAPTALRTLMKHGDYYIKNYDLSSCRILGSVGEPINPETWRWYYNVVGKKKCVIVDTYWQTETGGIVIAPIPHLFKMKPGSASLPFFGIQLEILNSKTLEPLNGPNVCGILCIKSSWPGMLRTVYGNHSRLIKTYFEPCPSYYFTGDGAYRDEDGYYWISGRIDDTLNVSGHRLGAAEIEHALVQHACISESAVVSFSHKVKGEGILCFVVKKLSSLSKYSECNSDNNNNDELNNRSILSSNGNIIQNHTHENYTDEKLIEELKQYVRKVIGPIATPDIICIVPDLPKTRSGKIIRRILRAIAIGLSDYGDISTVSNYDVIEIIKNKFIESKEKRYGAS
ncbi:acetyl-CoA synthetase [Plasmodium vinckei petteri]|uniref:acetate--CoA ligase n=1 Tax=Plasmodium vinckei petteri TaxID=138298 RepID=W7ANB1_PLAVN|nr:acetyl-CoA synthetase [Plasmodium vinckei petteri]CAD2108730.1 acetyl-CoA synthetase, putative [Plasmodium vinckei petteri]